MIVVYHVIVHKLEFYGITFRDTCLVCVILAMVLDIEELALADEVERVLIIGWGAMLCGIYVYRSAFFLDFASDDVIVSFICAEIVRASVDDRILFEI
ncbi:MAG: hypothetical protein GY941_30370 [Planctomycetes bacterium]|nr:hypothetical protein [Planctomycetota bacterium]